MEDNYTNPVEQGSVYEPCSECPFFLACASKTGVNITKGGESHAGRRGSSECAKLLQGDNNPTSVEGQQRETVKPHFRPRGLFAKKTNRS